MKYIDADKLKAEIERLIRMNQTKHGLPAGTACAIRIEAYKRLLDFLDTLPDEEQPTKGYDEAYLNEKIVKASKSWEGVDVDKFMDEVRGREPVTTCDQLGPVTDCHDLAEAAEKSAVQYYVDGGYSPFPNIERASHIAGFIAGAEWQNRKMMEGAVEEEVQEVYRDDNGIHCCVSVGTDYKPGTIVYVITIPKEEEQ